MKGLKWLVVVSNCTAGIIPFGGDADLDEKRQRLYDDARLASDLDILVVKDAAAAL
ncbi:MAG: hypothetical protein AB4911_13065 [Oscillochloridaceae bacterium umkhey_bin13]